MISLLSLAKHHKKSSSSLGNLELVKQAEKATPLIISKRQVAKEVEAMKKHVRSGNVWMETRSLETYVVFLLFLLLFCFYSFLLGRKYSKNFCIYNSKLDDL